MGFRDVIHALNRAIPSVQKPKQRPSLKERLLWTAITLVIFFLLSSVPLWGVPEQRFDVLRELRLVFAGSYGSLVELGIGPIVTAGIVIELLVGSGLIALDLTKPENREYFQSVQRVLSVIFIFVYSTLYARGSFGQVGSRTLIFLIIQLSLGSFMLMMLDDLVSKWGIGSGISLFILAGVTTRVMWSIFAPVTDPNGRLIGVLPALIGERTGAIYRGGLPDVVGLIWTIIVILVVVIAYQMKVNVPIAHAAMRGQRTRYPIRLLYVSNVPIIFALALLGDVDVIARIAWTRLGLSGVGWQRTLVSILGRYETDQFGGMTAVSGMSYYLATPGGLSYVVDDPLRAMIYLLVMVGTSLLFAKVWVVTSGMDPESVADQLVSQGMILPGRRASSRVVAGVIKDYINSVTILGGALVGFLAAIANFFGAIGTGSGLLLGVTITTSLYEIVARERMFDLYPKLKDFLGV